MCKSRVYKIKLDLLNHLVHDVRRFKNISALDASVYKQFKVHNKKAYRGSSRVRANCMQKTVGLMERQQRGDRPTISAEVARRSQILVHNMVCRGMEEGTTLLQPVWTVCLDEPVMSDAGGEKR